MFTSRFWKQPWRILWAAAAVMLCGAGLTNAAKPGGTGGGTVPAGRIYFFGTDIGVMTSMKADGSDKVPEFEWEPSRLLHDGHRWFLDVRDTPELGSYPPQGIESAIHARQEVFAVRDDGYAVQLTNDPLTKPQGSNTGLLRWSHTDSFISFIGVQWDANGVARGVICAASIAFVDGIPMLIEAPSVWMDSGIMEGWRLHLSRPAGPRLVAARRSTCLWRTRRGQHLGCGRSIARSLRHHLWYPRWGHDRVPGLWELS